MSAYVYPPTGLPGGLTYTVGITIHPWFNSAKAIDFECMLCTRKLGVQINYDSTSKTCNTITNAL